MVEDEEFGSGAEPDHIGGDADPGSGHPSILRPGDEVTAGQPLLTLNTDTPDRFDAALAALGGAWRIEPAESGRAAEERLARSRQLILDRIA